MELADQSTHTVLPVCEFDGVDIVTWLTIKQIFSVFLALLNAIKCLFLIYSAPYNLKVQYMVLCRNVLLVIIMNTLTRLTYRVFCPFLNYFLTSNLS